MSRYGGESFTRSSPLETMSEMENFEQRQQHPPPPPPMPRPTSNIGIGPNNNLQRKAPQRVSSFGLNRKSKFDSSPTLPSRYTERTSPTSDTPKSMSFRAAEKGKSDILPTHTHTPRHRSMSQTGLSHMHPQRSVTSPAEQLMSMTRSLRSRKRTSASDEDFGTSFDRKDRPLKAEWSNGEASFSHRPKDTYVRSHKLHLTDHYGQMAFSIIGLLVVYLVFDSYYRALETTEQITHFKKQESLMLLHLQRVEQQSIFLHENLGRLSEQGITKVATKDGAGDGKGDVETDLIWKQIHQVRQMEDEISHEVRTLQASLQRTDRSSIIHTFGEGPVQLHLDLDIPVEVEGGKRISILLWYDTPHAAWTLLRQVQAGKWNGVKFSLDRSRSLVATSTEVTDEDKLHFVESSQKTHEAWTVGLADAPDGGMSLFINLQENNALHKHDVCVGKVIDGFGALQKLVDLTRSDGSNGGSAISVKEVTASHLNRADTAGLL